MNDEKQLERVGILDNLYVTKVTIVALMQFMHMFLIRHVWHTVYAVLPRVNQW